MRSCLIQLLIAVAVIFALLWFGLPFGASWLATNALNAAGFTGTDTKVDRLGGPAAPDPSRPRRQDPADVERRQRRWPPRRHDRRDPQRRGADRPHLRQRHRHADRRSRARPQRRSRDHRDRVTVDGSGHGRDAELTMSIADGGEPGGLADQGPDGMPTPR